MADLQNPLGSSGRVNRQLMSLQQLFGNSLPPRIWPLTIVGTYSITFPLLDVSRSLDFQLTDESGRGDLTIEFMARGTYIYHEVQLDTYVDFATAGSQGQYFNLYIRDQGYDYERIA